MFLIPRCQCTIGLLPLHSCCIYFGYAGLIYWGLLSQASYSFFYSCHTWALGYSPMAQVSTDQRGRLMMTTERLNQSTDRIKESRRTMLETEELGVSILQDLHQQRQSLLHAHTTVCTCLSSTLCSVCLGVSCALLCYLHWAKIGFHITFHIPICSLIV